MAEENQVETAVRDRDLVRDVARVLFQLEEGRANNDAEKEAKKSAWQEGKEEAVKKGRTFIRRLEAKGLTIVRNESK